MSYTYFYAVVFFTTIHFQFSRGDNSNELQAITETTLALGRRYYTGCTVILHAHNGNQIMRESWKLTKKLATNLNHQGCVITKGIATYHLYLNKAKPQSKCSRVLNVICCDFKKFQKSFVELSHKVRMAGPLWLIFLSPNSSLGLTEYFAEVNAPFDADMLAGIEYPNGTVVLWELYRASASRPLRSTFFGYWSATTGLVADQHVSLYYRRTDMEGAVIKVGTTNNFPLVMVKKDSENNIVDINGYFATVWKDLERRLNFTSVYYEPNDRTMGYLRNGLWSGITGMVYRGSVHVGVAPFTISSERSKSVDFLRPLISTRNQLFLQKPGPEMQWRALFQPFHTNVWVAWLLWIFVAGIMLRIIVAITVNYHIEEKMILDALSPVNAVLGTLGAFAQQGSQIIPKASSSRIVFISSYLAGVIMITAYSGSLISHIALQTPRQPFKSMAELANDKSYDVVVVRGSAAYMYFANTSDSVLFNIYVNHMARNLQYNLVLNTEEALQRICINEKAVHYGPQAAAEAIMALLNEKGCDIIPMQIALNVIYQSMAINKGNQYKDALNHHLNHMAYQGILGRMKKIYWPDKMPRTKGKVIEMQIEQVTPIHIILLLGLLIALMVLLIEVIRRKGSQWQLSLTPPIRIFTH